ncbi:hypothetical protein, partial [Tropicimonas sp. IMCC34043]|uniref:hypothetical protein n=1 Tax=Tropicimonas sp. IMCC34043 TaxID=2248760 RepID=UPI001E355022
APNSYQARQPHNPLDVVPLPSVSVPANPVPRPVSALSAAGEGVSMVLGRGPQPLFCRNMTEIRFCPLKYLFSVT